MSKPFDEKTSRALLLEHARMQGYEKPILDIMKKVDLAIKHAKSKEEQEMIRIQGIQEIDAYFTGGAANLDGASLQGLSEKTIEKFRKR